MRDGSKDQVTPAKAMRRWYVVLAVWLIALAILPLGWVALGTTLWILAMIPGLIEIHQQFQNKSDPF